MHVMDSWNPHPILCWFCQNFDSPCREPSRFRLIWQEHWRTPVKFERSFEIGSLFWAGKTAACKVFRPLLPWVSTARSCVSSRKCTPPHAPKSNRRKWVGSGKRWLCIPNDSFRLIWGFIRLTYLDPCKSLLTPC